jgi:hypothetical protein
MNKLVIIISIFLITGCALISDKNVQTSSELLRSTQESIVNSASIIDEMCTAGELTQSQCDKASELYTDSKDVYTKALETQLFIIEAKIAGNEADLETKSYLQKLLTIMNKLSSIRE